MFQKDEKPMGIIPAVLDHLLSARKKTKSLMKNETDEFKKKVLELEKPEKIYLCYHCAH